MVFAMEQEGLWKECNHVLLKLSWYLKYNRAKEFSFQESFTLLHNHKFLSSWRESNSLSMMMGNFSMGDEHVTWASLPWHPHKIETWEPFFTTQFEHLCKTVNRTIYIISTILEKDLFYFILFYCHRYVKFPCQNDVSKLNPIELFKNFLLHYFFFDTIILLLEQICKSRFWISFFHPKLYSRNCLNPYTW